MPMSKFKTTAIAVITSGLVASPALAHGIHHPGDVAHPISWADYTLVAITVGTIAMSLRGWIKPPALYRAAPAALCAASLLLLAGLV